MAKESLGSELYSGAATFGKIRVIIGVIFGTIIGLALLVVGIVLIVKKYKLNVSTMGTIMNDPNCSRHKEKDSGTMYDCNGMNIAYVVDGKSYTLNGSTNSTYNYVKGNSIRVYYQSDKPSNAALSSDNTHIAGWISVLIGLVMLIGSWFWFIMAMKYKFVAAAEGVAGAAGLVSDAIHW